ncbi:META domain-containing protein [Kaarinaea lacus]
MKTVTMIIVFLLASALTASTMADEMKNKPMTPPILKDIAKTQWQLDLVQDNATQKSLPKEPPITIMLEENGKVAGGASVNRYFGEFALKDEGAIQWKGPGFGATMMAGPQDLMDFEQYYFKILHQCDRLSLNSERLIFHTQDGKLRLEYIKQ